MDAEAYDDHEADVHFQEHVVRHAIPYLERREVTTYQTIGE